MADDFGSFTNYTSSPTETRIRNDEELRMLQVSASLNNTMANQTRYRIAAGMRSDPNNPSAAAVATSALVGQAQAPTLWMSSLYNAAQTGGLRLQGPQTGGAPVSMTTSGMGGWAASHLFSQTEGGMGLGMNGFTTGRIANELMPTMANRGLFAGVTGTIETGADGRASGLSKGTGAVVKDKVGAATDMLSAVRDIFGDQSMTELLRHAEALTGMNFDASSVQKIQQMKGQIQKISKLAEAYGVSGQAMTQYTQQVGNSLISGFMAEGMNASTATRAGRAIQTSTTETIMAGRAGLQQARAQLPNGGDLPDVTDAELGEAKAVHTARALKQPGSKEFLAAQNILARNPNLSSSQRQKLEGMLVDYGGAKDKKQWAAGMDGFMRSSLGTNADEVSKLFNLGDLSQTDMERWNKDVAGSSDALKEPITALMAQARAVGSLKPAQMTEGMTKLASTFFSSFDAETQKKILDASDQGGPALQALMGEKDAQGNALSSYLPKDMSMRTFSGMLSGDARKGLRGLMQVAGTSAEMAVISNRQLGAARNASLEKQEGDQVVRGRDNRGTTGMFGSALQGFLDYADPNNALMQMTVAQRDAGLAKKTAITTLNQDGGITLHQTGADELMQKTGLDLFSEMGVKKGDYRALTKKMGTSAFQKVAMKLQNSGGNTQLVSDLELQMHRAGAEYNADGNFVTKDAEHTKRLIGAMGLSDSDFGMDASLVHQALTSGASGRSGMTLMKDALHAKGKDGMTKRDRLLWTSKQTMTEASEIIARDNNTVAGIPADDKLSKMVYDVGDMMSGRGSGSGSRNAIAPDSTGAKQADQLAGGGSRQPIPVVVVGGNSSTTPANPNTPP